MNAITENRFGPCVHCGAGPDNHRDDAGHPYEAAQELDAGDICGTCGESDCTALFGDGRCVGGEGGAE